MISNMSTFSSENVEGYLRTTSYWPLVKLLDKGLIESIASTANDYFWENDEVMALYYDSILGALNVEMNYLLERVGDDILSFLEEKQYSPGLDNPHGTV